jgi:hypothetical protein
MERNEKAREQKCQTKMTRRGGCGGSLGPDPEFFVSLQPRVVTSLLPQATAPRSVPLGSPTVRPITSAITICRYMRARLWFLPLPGLHQLGWSARRRLLRHSVRAYGPSDARSTVGAPQLFSIRVLHRSTLEAKSNPLVILSRHRDRATTFRGRSRTFYVSLISFKYSSGRLTGPLSP